MRYFVASICQKGLDKELVSNTLLLSACFETIIEAELPTNIVAKLILLLHSMISVILLLSETSTLKY